MHHVYVSHEGRRLDLEEPLPRPTIRPTRDIGSWRFSASPVWFPTSSPYIRVGSTQTLATTGFLRVGDDDDAVSEPALLSDSTGSHDFIRTDAHRDGVQNRVPDLLDKLNGSSWLRSHRSKDALVDHITPWAGFRSVSDGRLP